MSRNAIQATRSSPRQAFTLVELLVVVAIVGLLISILLPTLAAARRSANGTACLSNIRQLHVAMIGYANANRGALVAPPDVDPDASWFASVGLLEPTKRRLLLCPSVTEFAAGNAVGPSQAFLGEGSDFVGWTQPLIDAERRGAIGWNAHTGGQRIGSLRRPASVPLIGDCARPIGTPVNEGDAWNYAGFDLSRHSAGINLVYLDGHAANVKRCELAAQAWEGR